MGLLRAAMLYASIVLAIGFVLGAVRVLVVAPAMGEAGAVFVEVPVMVALSWLVWIRLCPVLVPRLGEAVIIGAFAFIVLQIGESLLAGLFGSAGFGANVSSYWSDRSPPRLIGIAGQVLFGLIPAFHAYKEVQR